jgi:formate dehydrogenase major subunit
MGIIYRREDKHELAAKGATVTFGSGNGKPAAGFAYIDNKPYPINEGETILSFLRRHFGKDYVPTLCDAPNLEPFGSCRVCSVDVALTENGTAKSQASCHTPVMANSYIYPH